METETEAALGTSLPFSVKPIVFFPGVQERGVNPRKEHNRFEALEVALEAVREVAAVEKLVSDSDLARQMRRAVVSVALNLAEGNRRRGRDRLQLFRVAAGSADEVVTALRIAGALGSVSAGQSAPALALLDRVLAMTWRLTRGR